MAEISARFFLSSSVGQNLRMRVLIASDSFGGTLSAQGACEAIAAGWRSAAPHDAVTLLPLSDGGPGFLSAMSSLPMAKTWQVRVCSPLGDEVDAQLVQVADTVYLESAQACGRQFTNDSGSSVVRRGSTFGVGQLLDHALKVPDVKKIVIGLGGSGTNDAGAGLLAAIGCESESLTGGGVGLLNAATVDLEGVRRRFAGIELLIATDVDNPLLGAQGATEVYGPQKGATAADIIELEAALTHFAAITNPQLALAPGAGAAGGLAFGLLLVGARRVSGIELVAQALNLDRAIAQSDLVITGEGSFDWQSLRGKVIAGVAHFAAKHGKPVVVIAGQVQVARREFMALGVESAYAVAENQAEIDASLADPARSLLRRAESVARTWSPAGGLKK
jgi:glycerate kinase